MLFFDGDEKDGANNAVERTTGQGDSGQNAAQGDGAQDAAGNATERTTGMGDQGQNAAQHSQ